MHDIYDLWLWLDWRYLLFIFIKGIICFCFSMNMSLFKYCIHVCLFLIIIKQRVCLCTNSWKVLLIPILVWRYPRYGVRTLQRDFFENRSRFLKIQFLSDLFLYFFITIFSSKYSTFLVLTASNRTENSLLNSICCTMIA